MTGWQVQTKSKRQLPRRGRKTARIMGDITKYAQDQFSSLRKDPVITKKATHSAILSVCVHVLLTCVSVNMRFVATSKRFGRDRYLLALNWFSSSNSCWLVNAVRGRRVLPMTPPAVWPKFRRQWSGGEERKRERRQKRNREDEKDEKLSHRKRGKEHRGRGKWMRERRGEKCKCN